MLRGFAVTAFLVTLVSYVVYLWAFTLFNRLFLKNRLCGSYDLSFVLVLVLRSSAYSFAVFCSPLWLMFVLYVLWGRRSNIDPIRCNFCMVLSMFFRLVLANPLYFLCETST